MIIKNPLPRRRSVSRLSFSFLILYASAAPLAAMLLTGCDAVRLGSGGTGSQFGAPTSEQSFLADAVASDQLAREIEEADIVKVVGDKVYLLNRFKGLIIIDVSDPATPAILGSLDLRGRGVEMYVIGAQIFALLSADYYFPYAQAGGSGNPDSVVSSPAPPAPDFEGSQIAVIDVADPANPALEGKLNLAGFAVQSRRVGNVIYVVGSNFYSYYAHSEAMEEAFLEGFVASVNIADPANIIPVDRETFSGHALEMHVSQSLILAAGQDYDPVEAETLTTVHAIDISDPAGVIAIRGSISVPGFIRNRFYMDDYQGVLRIATQSSGFGFPTVRVFTFDLADLDNITPLGQTEVIQNESLEAVRFDGPRGYLVTFFRVDPLFVVDLSDPANPAVTGFLEVPGFSTHIEPRGDRLLAVGIDDTDGRRPAVAYYDVADPANPSQIGRVVLGPPGSFTDSEATYDEKAFKVIDELGLIAIPFRHVTTDDFGPQPLPAGPDQPVVAPDYIPPSCMNAVQLVDFNDGGLTARGWFDHRGWVERVGLVGDRIFALSQAAFQTIEISDRDAPSGPALVSFFPPEELPFYADDCGYFGPIDPGFGIGPGSGLIGLLFQLILGELCGAMGVLPALALPLCLLFCGSRITRSRRPPARS